MVDARIETAGSPAAPRLPAPALAALYVVVALGPLVLSLGAAVSPADRFGLAAAALGMVGLAGMGVQFVTSGRFEIIAGRLGIDKVMAFHKFAAWGVLLAIVAHPLLYVAPTWLDGTSLGNERLKAYLTLPHYRSGVVAWAAAVLLVLSSGLRNLLPWRYELWRAVHVLLAATAVAGGLHHAVTTGRFSATDPVRLFWYCVAVAVVLVLATLYGYRWWRLHRRPWTLASVTQRADRMWELDIQAKAGTPELGYHAGQFVWMTEGGRRFPLFDHPFSIADSPARPGISLIIKEAGDFTNGIGRLAPGTAIGLDGPYGEFTLEAHPADAVLLIAGGVGIAPVMGLLRDMVARRDPRPVRLVYAVGQVANIACRDEIEGARATLDLTPMFVSETPQDGFDGHVGRLDRARLAELLDGLDPARTVALMCGPGPMVTSVSDTLLDLGLPMDNVIYERFDYSGGAASRQDRRRSLVFTALGAVVAAGIAAFALV